MASAECRLRFPVEVARGFDGAVTDCRLKTIHHVEHHVQDHANVGIRRRPQVEVAEGKNGNARCVDGGVWRPRLVAMAQELRKRLVHVQQPEVAAQNQEHGRVVCQSPRVWGRFGAAVSVGP